MINSEQKMRKQKWREFGKLYKYFMGICYYHYYAYIFTLMAVLFRPEDISSGQGWPMDCEQEIFSSLPGFELATRAWELVM